MARKRTVAAIQRDIERSKDKIAKERDRLRELIHEVESIADDCDEAATALETAADALSRYL